MFRCINQFMANNPMRSAISIAGGKCTIADMIIQRNNNNQWDYRRTLSFTSFGLIWSGGGQYILFNMIFPRIFGTGIFNGCKLAISKSLVFDQVVHAPFMYFPMFYLFRELGDSQKKDQVLNSAFDAWKNEIVDDMIIQVVIFLPVQIINFKYSPKHIRIPLLTGVGFIYSMFLSYSKY